MTARTEPTPDAGSPRGLFNLITQLTLALCLGATVAKAASPPAHGKPNSPGRAAEALNGWVSPAAIAASPDGAQLYLACATADLIMVLETQTLRVLHEIPLPGAPSGLALSSDGKLLYVTCAAPVSTICEVDLKQNFVRRTFKGRHTAVSPVLSADGRTLYVCQRFSSSVSVYDVRRGVERLSIPVGREPIAAALAHDGKTLLIAHHLPSGRADADVVAASLSLIDLAAGKVCKEWVLPNGSGLLREIRVSPDGAYACVAHNLARFQMPTTQLERGWMNTSALTLVDLKEQRLVNTVLLDDVDRGAANPWAVAWTTDGQTLCVTHAGTHELSVINFPELLAKLERVATGQAAPRNTYSGAGAQTAADVPNDLAFLVGLRQRIKLQGNGPRSMALLGHRAYVANYFSDSVEVIDLERKRAAQKPVALHENTCMPEIRRGEMLFNDASICFQGWQTCGSCHSEDARVDGFNWDLLNDGIGNPKNSKTLLFSHQTPPAMSMGVRETAETAVRAGIHHILFSVQPESVATAMDEWLKQLRPVPSPFLVDGQLSPEAVRGKKLFESTHVGCAECHLPRLWTDLRHYNVGTAGPFDRGDGEFDNPSLVEVWRTAPYLHDGSAATLRDVLTTRNPEDRHGRTSHLNHDEIEDLVAYLRSL